MGRKAQPPSSMPRASFPLLVYPPDSDDGHPLPPGQPLSTLLIAGDNDIPWLDFVEHLATNPDHGSVEFYALVDYLPRKLRNINGSSTCSGRTLFVGGTRVSIATCEGRSRIEMRDFVGSHLRRCTTRSLRGGRRSCCGTQLEHRSWGLSPG